MAQLKKHGKIQKGVICLVTSVAQDIKDLYDTDLVKFLIFTVQINFVSKLHFLQEFIFGAT